jgi:response regulator RpfG family c-di-GMP phosphodiesterase
MSLSEGTGGSSSPESAALGEVLAFFGIVADYAAAHAPESGERIASLAAGMAQLAGLPQEEIDALYFAARLRSIGALGNAGLAKGAPLTQREAMMHRWDIPAAGARLCEGIAALPKATADIVRWQAEAWDGTGYPDQLRWSGIPRAAQFLRIAQAYASSDDAEDALGAITLESGRTFAPEQTRTFVMWFHTYGGEIASVTPPYDALDASACTPQSILELLSQRVDAHNGTPQRAQRIADRVAAIGAQCGLDPQAIAQARTAALLFGIGELRAAQLETQQFDALARLGIDVRAQHATAAAQLAARCAYLSELAPILRARAEWYDGTGGPAGLRKDAIPAASRVLAAAIAFDAMEEAYHSRITEERTLPIARLETAAGTQFDPDVVRALSEVVKARA